MSDTPLTPALPTAQFQKFALAAALLTLGFCLPLWRLLSFALADDLHSYLPLMPLVSVYLAWTLKPELPRQSPPARAGAVLFFAAGLAVLGASHWLSHPAGSLAAENAVAPATLAWLLCLAGAGCWFLGGAAMWALVFPFALLLFMIPLPIVLRDAIEALLQHGSAMVADWMFALTGMSFWRNDTLFQLPGIRLEVAPECSGIHSTWVLFITSLVAGRMILRQPWKRAVLCLVVIPLALLRNGFRVFVIGELCVQVGPHMIDSPIHHHGGPLFFILSLLPFFLLLYLLRKSERPGHAKPAGDSEK